LSFSGGGAEGDEEGDSVLLALSAAYDKTDMELSKIDKSHLAISLQQGTCATNVLVRGGLIYTANVGDR
jgi:serine/threonine protein phosphatase PrpC